MATAVGGAAGSMVRPVGFVPFTTPVVLTVNGVTAVIAPGRLSAFGKPVRTCILLGTFIVFGC